MSTFSITYNTAYSDLAYETQMHDYSRCIRKGTEKEKLIEYYSACIIHLLLRKLSREKLIDKRKYSLEYICYYTPGIFKYGMHEILEKLALIACGTYEMKDMLDLISHVYTYECFSFTESDAGEILIDFVWYYLQKVDSVKLSEFNDMLGRYHLASDVVTFIHTNISPLQ